MFRFRSIVCFDEQTGVLRVSGDEDRMTSGRRRRPLSAALRATCDLTVDLSGLRYADASLMIDLACLAQRLRAHGRQVSLVDPPPVIRRLIELVGLHRLPSVLLVEREPAAARAG